MLLPPPKCVLKPKTETSSFLVLYSSASLPRSSSLETLARLGWRTSLELAVRNNALSYAIYIHCIQHLHDHLATTEEGVADELAGAEGNFSHVEGFDEST